MNKQTLTRQLKSLITKNQYTLALLQSTTPPTLSPLTTDQTFALFLKSGQLLDPRASTTLISHFSKLGDLPRARILLDRTHESDTISYNALISGFARVGSVFELFDELRHLGLVPDVYTVSGLVKGCVGLRENWVAHGVCLKLGLGFKGFAVSGLIENYARNGDVGSSEGCFEECCANDGVDFVVYCVMLNGYVWNGEYEKGKSVFLEIQSLGFELNEFSLTGVMGALFDAREGEQIHGFGVKMGFLCGGSLHLSNAVMAMYVRCRYEDDAAKLFDEIPDPDVVSWTERIAAARDGEEALELSRFLHSQGVEVNEYTFLNVFSLVREVKLLKAGKVIQALCLKIGYLQVVSVGNALVSMYGKCGEAHDARRVFDSITFHDSVSWNSLIAAYVDNNFVHEAQEVFSNMRCLSIYPTVYTIVSILETASSMNYSKLVSQVHPYMIKCGFMFDESTISSLITTYGRCSNIDESKRIFSEIDTPKLEHANALLATLANAWFHDDLLALFKKIWSSHLEVDGKTLSIILKSCGVVTDIEQGRAIHCLALKIGFGPDTYTETAVIDLYCKCGSIGEAEEAFRSAGTKNLAAWNAMTTGYAQHGYYQEVFKLFQEIVEFGIEPDEVTYLGVLTSCCHAGLVKEAQYYFNSMSKIHGIVPHLEHYACIVDLLGRVGLLEEAKQTIDQMPIQPDGHVWQILLSACNNHGHVELGLVAARKLIELQSENESAYVLLSNLYASAGMWDSVRSVRKEMKKKLLHKEPGSSWIQIEGCIRDFFVRDTLHLQSEEIIMELIKLYEQMFKPREAHQYDATFLVQES